MSEQTAIFEPLIKQTKIEQQKINKQKTPFIYKVLVVLTMMCLIGGSLTAVMTYMNVGYSDTFIKDWLSSFLAACTVMPVGFIMMGLMTKLIEKLLPNTAESKRNMLIGVVMAIIMESIMSFATAVNNIGLNHTEFFTGWLNGFLAALPLGLTLITVISLTVKPKIERFLKS